MREWNNSYQIDTEDMDEAESHEQIIISLLPVARL